MKSYSGGALITGTGYFYNGATKVSGESLLIKGLGHVAGGNNAYYLINFLADKPAWIKPRDSTTPMPSLVDFDASGNPVACQTYADLCYVESGNKVIQIGFPAVYSDGTDRNSSLQLNLSTQSPNAINPWSRLAALPGIQNACDCAAFEKSSNRIWYHRHQIADIGYYDVAANRYTEGSASPSWSHEGVMACDQNRGILCIVAQPLQQGTFIINFYNTGNGVGNDYYIPRMAGTAPTPTGTAPFSAPSVAWNQDEDCFVVWWGGKTLYKLKPPTSNPYAGGNAWTWVLDTPAAGDTPTNPPYQGCNGRFQYISNSLIRGYAVVNDIDQNIYFRKS